MSSSTYIIVGQGFAGTALAWQLLNRGQSVQIYDDHHRDSSSVASAGIINPITGLRLNHSGEYIQLKSACDAFYHALEKKLKTKFYHPLNIVKYCTRPEEKQAWDKKQCAFKEAGLLTSTFKANPYDKHIANENAGFETVGASVNARTYLNASRAYFKNHAHLIEESFDYVKINSYRTETAKIIFCEGFKAQHNPWFKHLPFINAKGELLTIKINTDSFPQKMINAGIFVLPLGNNLYKVGATYEWDDLTPAPTETGKSELWTKLRDLLTVDFKIVEHAAGIRPIIKDQTPVLGAHPDNPDLLIFNGLASKGALYSPLLSTMVCDYVIEGKAIDEKYSVRRFSRTLTA